MLAGLLILSGVLSPIYATYLLWRVRRQQREIDGLQREVNDVNKLMLKYGKYDERKN